jgi:hypothetical protein
VAAVGVIKELDQAFASTIGTSTSTPTASQTAWITIGTGIVQTAAGRAGNLATWCP